MRKAIYGALTLTALAVALLGAYRRAISEQSTPKNPPASAHVFSSEAPSVLTNETVKKTSLVHGSSSAAIPAATWTPVDGLNTITCPGTVGTTCTITADLSVQEVGNTAFNGGAVSLAVDGVLVCSSDASNGCHYTVEIPSDGRYVEATGLNQLSGVGTGSHTVQTFVWSDNGASLGNFNIRYQVLKP